jgi:hypothetical protein
MHQTGDFSINPRQSQADFWPERDATLPAPQQHDPCPVIRREGETNANYTRRRTCSVHCALDRSSQRSNQRQPGWPEITKPDGDPCGRFDAYDVRVRSFSPPRHNRPETHVETQHPLGGL